MYNWFKRTGSKLNWWIRKMQYALKNGEVVDAAIFVRDKIIPVDAKFSLENYNKLMEEKNESVRSTMEKEFKADLKKRIDETAKYVRPQESTTDFAFMFIPADGVFHRALYDSEMTTKLWLAWPFGTSKSITLPPAK